MKIMQILENVNLDFSEKQGHDSLQDEYDHAEQQYNSLQYRYYKTGVALTKLANYLSEIGVEQKKPFEYYEDGAYTHVDITDKKGKRTISMDDYKKNYYEVNWNTALPKTPEFAQAIAAYEKLKARNDSLLVMEKKAATVFGRVKKRLVAAKQSKSIADIPQVKIDVKDIPTHFYYTAKNKFENAYFKGTNRYAGTPEYYPGWRPVQLATYHTVVDALARNGLARPTVMYASSNGSEANFVMPAVNDRFFWRKHGRGQSAQNWMYVDGQRFNTTAFTSADKMTQDKMLASLKGPKP